MDVSDYRREYAAYNATLERERHRQYLNPKTEPRLQQIYDRYADLWTPESIKTLQQKWDNTPAHLTTERAGLHALIGAAHIARGEALAKEVTDELRRCSSSTHVDWNGISHPATLVPSLIADEPRAAGRRELLARWLDALSSCNDLRAARLRALRDAWQPSSLNNQQTLHEEITGVSYAQMRTVATSFLERTASAYLRHLTTWVIRNLPTIRVSDLSYADSLFFKRAKNYDNFFAARAQLTTHQAALNNMGIRLEGQNNLRFDNTDLSLDEVHARCFGINPPHEVCLVVGTLKGLPGFLTFFDEAGRAQHFAWVSSDMAARYPEFIFAPDRATAEGFGQLFKDLFLDPAWLVEHRALRTTEAREISALVALIELHTVRSCCAGLIYGIDLNNVPDPGAESVAASYATLYTEATGFNHSPTMHLHGAADDPAASASTCLRARAFATALGEHLRTRYGHRWWNAGRRATDELIDMWNTGARYSVEELASLTGIGNLDYDLLANSLVRAINGED